ncbi:hypothetical protein K437DRAFT_259395 [Tilletiaria anomala UBC 951]|uniref:Sodium/calcium exchanger membrane region domain-containing protein n=1 Tax=Tilletiaria anomala (strain ATCC 24038 / CBS 436.72 / UBC 951) TaxID=1037660 RepID=A0A066V9N9_TILAU|nr:uncharacterized protein K437DRAFT_259395 [Tilletiaria anomala UBC 951]KDN38447.1 hypothetical protein K437DRAFT_259395 [Tilletiaria anomala UBC 951]
MVQRSSSRYVRPTPASVPARQLSRGDNRQAATLSPRARSRAGLLSFIGFVVFSAALHLHLFQSQAYPMPDSHYYKVKTISPGSELQRRGLSATDFALPSCHHYLQFYYCSGEESNHHNDKQPHQGTSTARRTVLRGAKLLAILAWLAFLDFFCPNLATFESTAGVTLLSFGNSSPDIFSTYGAMRKGSGSLAIGELIGAASFIVSVVAGSVMLVADFQVRPFPFCRDVGFFAVALALMLSVLFDGVLHLHECIMLVSLYVAYSATIIISSWWMGDGQGARVALPEDEAAGSRDLRANPAGVRSYLGPLTVPAAIEAGGISNEAEGVSDEGAPHGLTVHPHASQSHQRHNLRSGILPRHSILGAIEFRDVLLNLRKESSADRSVELFQSHDPEMFLSPHYPSSMHSRHSLNFSSVRPFPRSASPTTNPKDTVTSTAQDRGSTSLHGQDDYFSLERGVQDLEPGVAYDAWRSEHSSEASAAQSATSRHLDDLHSSQTGTLLNQRTGKRQDRHPVRAILRALFPSLQNFQAKSYLGMFVSFATAPAMVCLNLTLPVVDDELEGKIAQLEKDGSALQEIHLPGDERTLLAREGDEMADELAEDASVLHSRQAQLPEESSDPLEAMIELSKARKVLTVVQCALAPSFCTWAVTDEDDSRRVLKVIIAAIVGCVLGCLAAFVVWQMSGRKVHPHLAATSAIFRCMVGFVVSVMWIMTIVDEVVLILQAIGAIAGVSHAILLPQPTYLFFPACIVLGLTIFAAGNSLGDFVANTSLAPLHPVMAISACFSAPMTALLLACGGSGLVILSQSADQSYEIDLSPTLLVSGIASFLILISLLVVVPLNNFHLTRKMGACLATSYVAVMLVNVGVEFYRRQPHVA